MSKHYRLMLAGLAFVFVVGLIPVLLPSLMIGAMALPTLLVISIIGIALIISVISAAQKQESAEKPKRGGRAEDVYARSELAVDDLDEEALDYLRRLMSELDMTQTLSEDEPAEEKEKRIGRPH